MKNLRKIAWIILILQLALILYVLMTFKVDDVTLSKGEVTAFNKNWTLIREDGSTDIIELPYYEDSKANKKVVIENVISKEYWGKTISFLTADKNMRIFMDGKLLYEFGVNDERSFGKTPGSVTNFVDIPNNLVEGKIRIELESPYDNYAACIDAMTISERDISILGLLTDNLLSFGCAIVILLSGMAFCMLAITQKIYRQSTDGMEYLSVYCLISFVYYCIETKAMNLFYGNQTLYSVLVFLILMALPIFLIPYYEKRLPKQYAKGLYTLMIFAIVNVAVQIPLQIFNVVDFMNMAAFSHILLFMCIIVMLKNLYMMLKEKKSKVYTLEFIALVFMGLCGVSDIVRSYLLKVEHLEKYSRYGTTVFCFIMLVVHVIHITRRYSASLEENAELLKQKVDTIEKKNAELSIAREEAIAANSAKSIFLARMSHEIRTPINAVLGMNEMILRESKEDEIKGYAKDVAGAAQVLLDIINEILDLSKIESGKMTLVSVEYDMASVLHDIANMVSLRAKNKQLDFQMEVQEDIPAILLGDDVKLRQILTNLLSNAVKYTHKGVVKLKVSGERKDENVKLHFEVSDTGIGIKEEDMPKLFEAFQRIEEGRNRNIEGTGLGMNITIQLLKLMGSRLCVESEYEKGSTFSFVLEQKIIKDVSIGNLEERLKRRNMDKDSQEKLYMPGIKILMVDDNEMNRKVFCSLLKDSGIEVTEADSGKTCLYLVKENQYDIIFLDHMMPEMDGVETLLEMKEMKKNMNKETPVIVLTANAISGAKEQYLEVGFDGYLSKPIDPKKLEKVIQSFCS